MIPKTLEEIYSFQIELKKRIKEFLSNTEKIPKELLFVGRNLNIVRSLNNALGSPVNRISIMSRIAISTLGSDLEMWQNSNATTWWSFNISPRINYVRYWTMIFVGDVWFGWFRFIEGVSVLLGGRKFGYEEFLTRRVKDVSGIEMGYEAI